jgi:serine/threonine protein kinase
MIMPNPTEESKLLGLIKEKLPQDKYSDLQVCDEENSEAGTRACFTGKWGGGVPVFIKVDKTPKSENGQRHMDRGYNTGHEIDILTQIPIDEALDNSIVPIMDFHRDDETSIFVAPKAEGESLKRYKERGMKIGFNDFKSLYTQVIRGSNFFKQKGLYHRDLSPQNIIINKNGKLTAKIIDPTNACEISKLDNENHGSEYIPTSGAKIIRDPTLNAETKYSDANEIYAIGKNMLFSLTGESFEFDPLNSEFDSIAYQKLVKSAIKQLPNWARKKYGKILDKATTCDENKRYSTLEEFQSDFISAGKPNMWQQLVKSRALPTIAAAALVGGIGSYISIDNLHNDKKILEQVVAEAEKYPATAEWNGSDIELNNNLFEFNPTVAKREPFKQLYDKKTRPEYLSLQPGDKLEIIPRPDLKPLPGKAGSYAGHYFPGKVYIEGFKGIEFRTEGVINDPQKYDMSGPNIPWVKLDIPKDIPQGVWNLAIELYAPVHKKNENYGSALDHIRFKNPGRAIARKRIPIVIGSPDTGINVTSVGLGNLTEYYDIQRIIHTGKKLKKGLSYECSVPEINFKQIEVSDAESYNAIAGGVRLPNPKNENEVTMQIIVRDINDGNKIINYNAFPMKANKLGDNFYGWNWSLPGENFSKKLVEYRKQAIEGKKLTSSIPQESYQDNTLEQRKVDIVMENTRNSIKGSGYEHAIHYKGGFDYSGKSKSIKEIRQGIDIPFIAPKEFMEPQ